MEDADGSRAMDTMAVVVTSRLVDPFIAPTLAVIVVFPTDREVARPAESMLAMLLLLLAHTADCVSSCKEPSLKMPVALNCTVCPSAIVEASGAISSPVS
jgi:hypothetical protein